VGLLLERHFHLTDFEGFVDFILTDLLFLLDKTRTHVVVDAVVVDGLEFVLFATAPIDFVDFLVDRGVVEVDLVASHGRTVSLALGSVIAFDAQQIEHLNWFQSAFGLYHDELCIVLTY